jgi:hypothetical protein
LIDVLLPLLDVSKSVHQNVKINSLRCIEVKLIAKSSPRLFGGQGFIKRVLCSSICGRVTPEDSIFLTIDMITTQGRFKEATMASARDVFPDPELPATPMMLASPHGGE